MMSLDESVDVYPVKNWKMTMCVKSRCKVVESQSCPVSRVAQRGWTVG